MYIFTIQGELQYRHGWPGYNNRRLVDGCYKGDCLQQPWFRGRLAKSQNWQSPAWMRTLRQHRQQSGGCLSCIIWSKVELNTYDIFELEAGWGDPIVQTETSTSYSLYMHMIIYRQVYLVVGGHIVTGDSGRTATTEVLVAGESSWNEVGPLPLALSGLGVVSINNNIFSTGKETIRIFY